MPLLDINDFNFEEQTDKHQIAILDFWAPWCGPCKAFAPTFEAAAAKHPDILFGKINTEEETDLARQFEVRSIPTILASKNGEIVAVQVGALTPAGLDELIGKLRA